MKQLYLHKCLDPRVDNRLTMVPTLQWSTNYQTVCAVGQGKCQSHWYSLRTFLWLHCQFGMTLYRLCYKALAILKIGYTYNELNYLIYIPPVKSIGHEHGIILW